jgi:hypothetical protein
MVRPPDQARRLEKPYPGATLQRRGTEHNLEVNTLQRENKSADFTEGCLTSANIRA